MSEQTQEIELLDEFRDEHFVLSRDLKKAAATMSEREARFLVDAYYQSQEQRIRTAHQRRSAAAAGEPHGVVSWFYESHEAIENSLKGALGQYAKSKPLGRWALSIHGIGPVITAGLLANIDISRCETVGHIWSYAGLDPRKVWNKGEKRPWNASLKRLCWITSGSFVKFRASEKDYYGKVYEKRKAYEIANNEAGNYAEQAQASLETRAIKDKDLRATYEEGRLPKGRIELRARRYAVKLFLAHYHYVGYELLNGRRPPRPYVIEHMGHAHEQLPPNWPMALNET